MTTLAWLAATYVMVFAVALWAFLDDLSLALAFYGALLWPLVLVIALVRRGVHFLNGARRE